MLISSTMNRDIIYRCSFWTAHSMAWSEVLALKSVASLGDWADVHDMYLCTQVTNKAPKNNSKGEKGRWGEVKRTWMLFLVFPSPCANFLTYDQSSNL
jgi:hypothetical protein